MLIVYLSHHEFANQISNQGQAIFGLCLEVPLGALDEPLTYEVADVCSGLKLDVSVVSIAYERIRYAGPLLWKFLV